MNKKLISVVVLSSLSLSTLFATNAFAAKEYDTTFTLDANGCPMGTYVQLQKVDQKGHVTGFNINSKSAMSGSTVSLKRPDSTVDMIHTDQQINASVNILVRVEFPKNAVSNVTPSDGSLGEYQLKYNAATLSNGISLLGSYEPVMFYNTKYNAENKAVLIVNKNNVMLACQGA